MAEKLITRDPKALGERLWTLKTQKKFCDASLLVNGQKIPVHANVLASFSQFFEDTFENEDISPKEVTFTDIDKDVMESLIEYCYRGSLKITFQNARDIYQLANILEMSTVVENCIEVTKDLLNAENCIEIWKMSKTANSEKLKNDILSFVEKNFEEVTKSQEFLALENSEVKELLNLSNESKIDYEAVKKWIEFDNSRKNQFVDLLDYVNMEYLPKDFLIAEAQWMCKNLDGECYEKFLSFYSPRINTLMVFGGNTIDQSRVVEIFDLHKKEWIKVSYGECNKQWFTSVLLDDQIMIIGGNSNGTVNTAEYYDLKTGKTKSLPPMSYRRQVPSAVTFKKCVYVFGGINEEYLSSIEKWNPSTNKWQNVAPMAIGRCSMGIGILEDEIFITGGYNGNYLSETEAYNPVTNKWRKCADLNEKKSNIGSAVVNGFLYVVGGFDGSIYLKTAERYDKIVEKWTMIDSLEIERNGLSAGNLNGQLVITGGYNNNRHLSIVEMYDEQNKKWKISVPLKLNRSYHYVVEVPWALAELALARKS